MAINRDLSDMPFAGERGFPPSRAAFILPAVFDRWYEQWQQRQAYAPALPDRRFRASSAGKRCDRALQYEFMGVEGEPIELQTAWRFEAGHYVHNHIGEQLVELGTGWRREVRVDLKPLGVDGSAHADYARMVCREHGKPMLVVRRDPWQMPDGSDPHELVTYRCSNAVDILDGRYCETRPLYDGQRGADWDPPMERAEDVVEAKSKGGFQYKKAATNVGGPPIGPAHGDIMQGALAAKGLDCNRLSVIYVALENISNGMAESMGLGGWSQFAGEWHYAITDLAVHIDAEIARINRLLRATDAGVLVTRELSDIQEYPVGAHIVTPKLKDAPWIVLDGDRKIASGRTWQCGYCSMFERCVADGPGGTPAPTEDVV